MKGPQLSVFNFSIKNYNDGSTLDIHIDGEIVDASTQEIMKNFWGDETSTSFKSFRNQIDQANFSTLNVYVNSTGGHVGDAMAMHDYLAELESKGKTVNRIGRGIIASSATYLMVGNNSSMTANSMMMIHNVGMLVYGDIVQCENQVKAGRKFNNLIRDFYAGSTGKPAETVSSWMNKETWFNAQEAKENGFVKNITGEASFSNSIKPEQWPFQNTTVLNTYNSYTNSNTPVMDIQKITDAIKTGFTSLLEDLKIVNKKDEKPVQDAFEAFSTSITNAIKDGMDGIKVPDNEAITTMVNEAVTNALKTLPENFTAAITEATKDNVKKTDLDNLLNKADFKTQMDALTNSIVAKIGGATNPEAGNEDDDKLKNTGRRKVANKFSGFFADYNN
jgi:ATP-dependent Clp protease protease subunit